MSDRGFLIGILVIGLVIGISFAPLFDKLLSGEDSYSLVCIEGHQYIYKTMYHRAALAPNFNDEGYPVKCSMEK